MSTPSSPPRRGPLHGRRGSNAIEFGFTLPVLFSILFAILEYGTMFNRMLSVQSATRDGARWAATPNFDVDSAPEAAIEHVRESLGLLGVLCDEASEHAGACTIIAESDPLEGYEAITVTTEIQYVPITGGLLPAPASLRARSSFVLADQTPSES